MIAGFAAPASAHVSYAGRDYLANGTVIGNTYTLGNQRVASAFGWADAADADWGDSHRGRFAKFTLAAAADVTIKVWQQDDVSFTSSGNTVLALNDLVPAFSLYRGVAPGGAHDGGDHPDFHAAHPGYLPTSGFFDGVRVGDKEGAWRSTASFVIGNTESEVPPGLWAAAQLTFIGMAIDGAGADINGDDTPDLAGDGMADGMISRTFRLDAGSYSVVIGGACYGCQSDTSGNVLAQRGFTTSLTLQPVPEPGTWAMVAGGLALLGAARRRSPRPDAGMQDLTPKNP